MNDFEALYIVWNDPGIIATIERGEKHLPGAPCRHVSQHELGQVHRRAHVEIDDAQISLEIAVDKLSAATGPHVQSGGV